ncbi:MAG: ABC-ATPase domain-containing protein, partial [Gemmatimonadota bacterium]
MGCSRQYAAARSVDARNDEGKEKARLRGAYKRIAGSYDFGDFTLHIDYVQGDPFASPSRLRAVFSADVAQVPADLLHSVVRRAAAAD